MKSIDIAIKVVGTLVFFFVAIPVVYGAVRVLLNMWSWMLGICQ